MQFLPKQMKKESEKIFEIQKQLNEILVTLIVNNL